MVILLRSLNRSDSAGAVCTIKQKAKSKRPFTANGLLANQSRARKEAAPKSPAPLIF
jgi:hypothetical protein